MGFRMRHWLVWLAFALGAATAGAAWAQGGPGVQFLSVIGDVRIVGRDGAQRPAERGAELRDGETIQTGANALAQLRLADGGLLSVRADTELKLDRFAYAGRDDRNASFLVSLLKGGFRSITGLIGQVNRDGYRVTTPSATIGIRGTDFDTLVLTAARPDVQMEAGTFARVHRGEIVVRNLQQVAQIVRPDETGFVGLGAGAAPRLVPLPTLLRTPTPVVAAPPPAPAAAAGPGAAKGDAARTGQTIAPGARELRTTPLDAPTTAIKPGATSPVLISPIQQAPAGTLQTAPTTGTIQTAPTTTIQTAPLTSPILTAPTTSTIQTAPTTTIQTAPLTSPILTAPTTSTIQTAPIQTAPTTTLQTAPLQTAPSTIQSPALKAPIAPMMTKP
jgi:hypothetical protein